EGRKGSVLEKQFAVEVEGQRAVLTDLDRKPKKTCGDAGLAAAAALALKQSRFADVDDVAAAEDDAVPADGGQTVAPQDAHEAVRGVEVDDAGTLDHPAQVVAD